MFLEINRWMINVDYIAHVYFYEKEYTYEKCCLITMKDGERIRIEDTDQTQDLREKLRSAGFAVVSVESGEETDG